MVVDITKDAQLGLCRPDHGAPVRLPGYRPRRRVEAAELDEAARLIDAAERPLVFCGHGVVKAEATALLRELVDKGDLPVACTLLGLGGFPASDPRHLGMMGMHGEAWVNEAVQRADLLVALGMRFDDRVTGNLASYARGAKKIHVELDPAEVGKNVACDVAIVGDVKDALRGLVPRIAWRRREGWRAEIAALREDAEAHDVQRLPDDGRLLAAHVMADLHRLTGGEALVVTDVGQHQMWEAQYYRHEAPRSLITSGGLGTMGFALPAAIGARFARPGDEIWVIAGDGGFQMSAAELSTCMQEGVQVNVAIINNGYLGMVRQWQDLFYEKRYVATPIVSPDFVKLAEAHGLSARRVTRRDEIEDAVGFARMQRRTCVIEFQVAQEDTVYPMVPAGNDLADMIRRPRMKGVS